LAIVALTALAYQNALKNDYVNNWDDDKYVIVNPAIKSFSTENIKEIFTNSYGACYLPVTMMSYIFDNSFFSGTPETYHTTNVIIHLLNVILVFLFIRSLTKRYEIASIVTLVFALHPMHVESVAWISERKDVVYTFFFLASLIFYIKYIEKSYQLKYLIYCLILFVFSLLSKPAAVPLPFILILIDYFYSRKLFSVKVIIEKIPFILLSLVFGIITIITQKNNGGTIMAPSFPVFDRFFLISHTIIFYIVKMFVPWNLCAIYYYPHKINGFLPFEYYLSPFVILLVIYGIYKAGSFRKYLIFGLLFYLSCIFMVIHIIPIGLSITSDRYSYMSFIGIAFIVGYFYIFLVDKNKKIKSTLNIIFLAIAIVFSVMTWSRNEVWANGIELFIDVAKKNPTNPHAWAILGNAKRNNAKNNEDFESAIDAYDQSIKLKNDAEVLTNRGYVKAVLKNFTGAISDYHEAVKADSSYGMAYYNLAVAIDEYKPDYPEEVKIYSNAIKFKYINGEIYNNRGVAKFKAGDVQGAISDYNHAIQLVPNFAGAYFNRGLAKSTAKQFKEAMDDFNSCLKIDPNIAIAYLNRGLLKFNSNDKPGACIDWQIAAGKGSAEAQNYLNSVCK